MSFSSDPALLVNQLPISVEMPKDFEQFREIMSELYKRIANSTNTKEGALYSLQEFSNFKQYYTTTNTGVFRNVYRKVFDLVNLNGGNIGAGATVAFAHGITGLSETALIYAGCTSATPTYFSVMGPTDVWLDAVNINFTNPLGAVALTKVSAVCEYLKN